MPFPREMCLGSSPLENLWQKRLAGQDQSVPNVQNERKVRFHPIDPQGGTELSLYKCKKPPGLDSPWSCSLHLGNVFFTECSFLGVFLSLNKEMSGLCLSTEVRNEIHLNVTSPLGVTKYAEKLEYLLVVYTLELFFSYLYGSWQDRTIYWELNNDICYQEYQIQ